MSAVAEPATPTGAGRSLAVRVKRAELARQCVVLVGDLVAFALAFLLAALSSESLSELLLGRQFHDFTAEEMVRRATQYGLLALGAILALAAKGHYRRRLPFWSESKHIVMVGALALMADGFLQFAAKEDFSRLWLFQSWTFAIALLIAARNIAKELLRSFNLWNIPVLVVGRGEAVTEAVDALHSEKALGYRVVAIVPPERSAESGANWEAQCDALGAQMIIISMPDGDPLWRGDLISQLTRLGLPFAVVPPTIGMPVLGLDRQHFFTHDVMLLLGRNNLAQPYSRAIKMLFDYVTGAVLLLAALPLFVVCATLIKLDGGPVFFAHSRLGRGGRPFKCLKFRTMAPNADALLRELLSRDPVARREWEADMKLRNDPRVTWIGQFLRISSLDELPQLINVLRGEMSLVGPRPIVRDEVDRYGDDIFYYYQTRPGLTGLWQVSGRNNTTYAQRVRLDVWYAKNWSLWYDIAILLKTVPAVFGRFGAY